MPGIDNLIGRKRCGWGVFKIPKRQDGIDYSEIHVAPLETDLPEETAALHLVERVNLGTTVHHLDGMDCWCRPRRDDETANLIVHNEAS